MKCAHRSSSLIIATFFLMALSGSVRANMVNLYDWTRNDLGSVTSVNASDSAYFASGGSLVYPHTYNESILTDNLATTPGNVYEIAFTIQNTGLPPVGATMSFGNFSVNLWEINQQWNGYALGYAPLNFDVTVVASAPLTAMSFDVTQDNSGYGVSLSNLSVTDVPEQASTAALLVAGLGGLLVCTRRWSFKA